MGNRAQGGILGPARALLLAGAALAWAQPAASQTDQTPASEPAELGAPMEEITIVGSRIGGFAEGALPVTVVTDEELAAYGAVNTGELVSFIPQVGDLQFTDNNTATNGARGDVASVSLRGLGSGNTLSLIDGRRMVQHPLSQAIDDAPVTFFNVNSIPSASIQRVEVLRDGASALYGADATAGVVNFVTFDDYEGLNLSARYGLSDQSPYEQLDLTARYGLAFNEGRTRFNVGGTFYSREEVFHVDLPEWYQQLDRRDLLPEGWQGDTQFDNRSTLSPFGRFRSGRLEPDGTFTPVRVRRGTENVTSASGLFFVDPDDATGFDDGSLPRELRYNFIQDEIVIPDVERWNALANLSHEFSPAVELFASFSYYDSKSVTQRAPGPLDSSLALIIVPAANYYNPLGPVGSPNRLPGINAPAAGLDVVVEGYRPLEQGPRIIEVDQDSFRALAGLRGQIARFDWEAGFLYSEANARDEEFNRISKTLLQEQAELTTPDAFNFFGGPFVNPQSVLDRVTISTVRRGKATLALADLRVSRDNLVELPGGPLGVATGVEWRRETIFDDSDPRLDGTITYTNGAIPDESDVVGVSATQDFRGDRDVWSAYAEVVVPLVDPEMDVPLVHRLDLQFAGRYEEGSDFDGTFTPKVAGHWFPLPFLSFRASYGEGFRAPNLVQLNQGTITRRGQDDEDFYREDVTASPADLGETYRPSLRRGNPDLEPETSETYTFGVVLEPKDLVPGLRLTVDYFHFEQENLISTFGVQEQLALDFLLRTTGQGSNPNVIRAEPTAADLAAFAAYNAANPGAQRTPAGEVTLVLDNYVNLDPRTVEGLDFGLRYQTPPWSIGTFVLDLAASHLLTFRQEKESLEPLLADPVLGDAFSAVQPDRLNLNGNPDWRATGTLLWSLDRYSAAVAARYVGAVEDTSARNDETDSFWPVREFITVNARFTLGLGDEGTALYGTELTLGVNNIAGELGPYADESPGYLDSLHNVRGREYYVSLSREF